MEQFDRSNRGMRVGLAMEEDCFLALVERGRWTWVESAVLSLAVMFLEEQIGLKAWPYIMLVYYTHVRGCSEMRPLHSGVLPTVLP